MTESKEQSFDKASVSFEKLNPEMDVSALDCTDDGMKDPFSLNEFIHKHAVIHQANNLGTTLVMSYQGVPVGYAMIAASTLQHAKMLDGTYPRTEIEDLTSYPAVIIANLAIDRNQRGKDFGSYLLTLIKGYCRTRVSERLAVRFLVLKARPDERVIKFYKDNGFVLALQQERQHTKLMYIDLFPERNLPDDDKN